MHYHVEVIVPGDRNADPQTIVKEAEAMLAPFNEEFLPRDDDGEDDNWPAFTFDWYQIGARWRGIHSGALITDDIEPETCRLCSGTGTRPDMDVPNGCNGCNGEGREMPWPTTWGPHGIDVCPAEEADPELTAQYVVSPDGVIGHWSRDSVKVPRLSGTWLVTVDAHS